MDSFDTRQTDNEMALRRERHEAVVAALTEMKDAYMGITALLSLLVDVTRSYNPYIEDTVDKLIDLVTLHIENDDDPADTHLQILAVLEKVDVEHS